MTVATAAHAGEGGGGVRPSCTRYSCCLWLCSVTGFDKCGFHWHQPTEDCQMDVQVLMCVLLNLQGSAGPATDLMRQIEVHDVSRLVGHTTTALPGPAGWAPDTSLSAFQSATMRHSRTGNGGGVSDDLQVPSHTKLPEFLAKYLYTSFRVPKPLFAVVQAHFIELLEQYRVCLKLAGCSGGRLAASGAARDVASYQRPANAGTGSHVTCVQTSRTEWLCCGSSCLQSAAVEICKADLGGTPRTLRAWGSVSTFQSAPAAARAGEALIGDRGLCTVLNAVSSCFLHRAAAVGWECRALPTCSSAR